MKTVDVKERVAGCVDALFDEEVSYVQELVRRPSRLGETNACQRFVAESLAGFGLDVNEETIDVERLRRDPRYAPVSWSYEGLINVIATAKAGAAGGRSLILNGHIDVVPEGHHDQWHVPPWSGVVKDGKLYGRGAGDMKGGIAAAIFALRAVQHAGCTLKGDVIVETVIDEECCGNGTLATLVQGHHADGAIIPEPLSGLVIGSTGVMWCQIRVFGRGAHAQSAAAAVNAAEKAYPIIKALRAYEEELNAPARRHPIHEGHPHPYNINLGGVHGGVWASSVPEDCKLDVRIGFPPGISIEQMHDEVRGVVRRAADADPWLRENPPVVEFNGFHAPGWFIDTETDLFKIVQRNMERRTGKVPSLEAITGTTDNRYFSCEGIPNVCFGPAAERIHAIDECVDLASLREVTHIIAATIIDFVGVER